jgi:S-(hydroxymethyl)glutathione dehydrogenase/alcohol dehydrogenase
MQTDVSCGVATGLRSAVKRADVRPGETVVVVGIGGVGINAVQGARMAGARQVIAIDPLEFKRAKAIEFEPRIRLPRWSSRSKPSRI